MRRKVRYYNDPEISSSNWKFSKLNLGIVQFINEVVDDANIDLNGDELFERVKDGILLK